MTITGKGWHGLNFIYKYIYGPEIASRNKNKSSEISFINFGIAEVAQLAEQLIRNEQAVGSNPTFGLIGRITLRVPHPDLELIHILNSQPVLLVLIHLP